MKHFWQAVIFLTVVPAPAVAWQEGDLGRAGRWFPVVGLLMGGGLTAAWWLLHPWFPPTVTAVLLLILWVAVTGGLHLDGLADCGDGLLAPVPAELRREIMRDPRLGAFGGIVLVLALAAKLVFIAHLPGPAGLLVAPTGARWLLLLAAKQPTAHQGMGASFAAHLPAGVVGVTAVVPFGAAVLAGGWIGLAAVGLAGAAVYGLWRIAQARLGGLTGDVYGATVEVAELAVLLPFLLIT